MRSYFDYIQSRCTQGSFGFCHKHGSLTTMLAFIPNKFDPFDWFIPNLLMRSYEERFRLHPESLHSG
jgi:hypothetical protein